MKNRAMMMRRCMSKRKRIFKDFQSDDLLLMGALSYNSAQSSLTGTENRTLEAKRVVLFDSIYTMPTGKNGTTGRALPTWDSNP